MKHISSILKAGIAANEALPAAMRGSAAPFILATLPVLVCSILGAFIVMPIVVALTAYQLFLLVKVTDPLLFTLDKKQSRLRVTFPMCTYIALWGIFLAMMGRSHMLNGIVGPFCILLLIACAPAYRWNALRTARRFDTRWTFSITGAIAVAAALAFLF